MLIGIVKAETDQASFRVTAAPTPQLKTIMDILKWSETKNQWFIKLLAVIVLLF